MCRLVINDNSLGVYHQHWGTVCRPLSSGDVRRWTNSGTELYLTMVYKREEQAKRMSYLFVCTAIAGAFGGLLAYLILKMDGIGGRVAVGILHRRDFQHPDWTFGVVRAAE